MQNKYRIRKNVIYISLYNNKQQVEWFAIEIFYFFYSYIYI